MAAGTTDAKRDIQQSERRGLQRARTSQMYTHICRYRYHQGLVRPSESAERAVDHSTFLHPSCLPVYSLISPCARTYKQVSLPRKFRQNSTSAMETETWSSVHIPTPGLLRSIKPGEASCRVCGSAVSAQKSWSTYFRSRGKSAAGSFRMRGAYRCWNIRHNI